MQLYDRIAAGDRIRQRRLLLGMTQEELAEKIGRAYKYCQDIERGSCGMSIETLILLSSSLNVTMDYIIYGYEDTEPKTPEQLLEIYCPICFATSAAKSSFFFSIPSPVSKRTNFLTAIFAPLAFATSATYWDTDCLPSSAFT